MPFINETRKSTIQVKLEDNLTDVTLVFTSHWTDGSETKIVTTTQAASLDTVLLPADIDAEWSSHDLIANPP